MQHFLGIGMLGAFGLVNNDAEPRRIRHLPKAVDATDGTLDDVEIPRHGAHHFLLDDMVGGRDRKMQRGDPGDRAERIVRRHANAQRLGTRGDFLCLHQATAVADVGLHDVDCAGGE